MLAALLSFGLAAPAVAADRTPAPADAAVYLITPADGETLPSGTHTLQLLLGDLNHVPHDPPVVSERITVTVR
jgi:hypothetical protein